MISIPETPQENKLEFLQRQSWQLELIITGFALASMISGADRFHDVILVLSDLLRQYEYIGLPAAVILWGINLTYFVTIFHFFMNVVLRCLWIGSLALRGMMNQETYLNDDFAPKYANFLQRRHGNFDQYINRLDKAASLVFAFTFLLVAILFGVIFYLLVYAGIFVTLAELFGNNGAGIGALLFFVYLFLGIVYLADFLTTGAFKRGGDAFYYRIYRLMGWLTLARLYRPLYYAVISNRWGKRLILAIVPYILLIVLIPRFTMDPIPYIDREDFLSNEKMKSVQKDWHYADSEGFRRTAVGIYLESDLITDNVLRVHLPLSSYYAEELDRMIELENTVKVKAKSAAPSSRLNARPEQDTTSGTDSVPAVELTNEERIANYRSRNNKQGENLGRWLSGQLPKSNLPPNADSLLVARFLRVMDLSLDSTSVDPANVLLSVEYEGSPQPELVAYFPLYDLEPGMHRVAFREFKLATKGDEKGHINLRRTHWVPFFYAPN
ncbi:hypothetical protein [Lewinella sp. 4G2]|uniref:hypothetical protein n=1 Tax=Lewinella sp. 4G2 TaxID=1803372 RepID=UPI0007B48811|nr:hypothetical protein [Lewinella sp. 4G2]OAV43138.1 hypothetical protein A3850_000900 [Lewinella sp. 4G2]